MKSELGFYQSSAVFAEMPLSRLHSAELELRVEWLLLNKHPKKRCTYGKINSAFQIL